MRINLKELKSAIAYLEKTGELYVNVKAMDNSLELAQIDVDGSEIVVMLYPETEYSSALLPKVRRTERLPLKG